MHAASVRPAGTFTGSLEEAWQAVQRTLGLSDAVTGERRDTSINGGPRLVGTVEDVRESPKDRALTLRLEQPSPGVVLIGTYGWGGKILWRSC
jgi:hypothetical protein